MAVSKSLVSSQLSTYLDSIQTLLNTGHFDQAELLFEKFQEEYADAFAEEYKILFEAVHSLLAVSKTQRRLISQWQVTLEDATREEVKLEGRLLSHWVRMVAVIQAAHTYKFEDQTETPIQNADGLSGPTASASSGRIGQPHWRRLLNAMMISPPGKQEEEFEINSKYPATGEPEDADIPQPLAAKLAKPVDKSELAVYALGSFRLFINGRQVEKWWGNKGRSLLKYFLANRDRPIHRDILMDMFWGEDEPEAARRNLHQAIYSLRRSLQTDESIPPIILFEDNMYFINPQIEVWSDFESFLQLYYQAKQLDNQGQRRIAIESFEAAASIYSGDFMGEDLYEAWPFLLRENLKLAYLDLLDEISQHYLAQKNFPLAILYCRQILEEDNCREDIHRRLMRAYMSQGQRHLAINQYFRCEEALLEELDVEPMPATVMLFQEIQNNPLNFAPSQN